MSLTTFTRLALDHFAKTLKPKHQRSSSRRAAAVSVTHLPINTGAIDLAAQIERLGPDSLLPDF